MLNLNTFENVHLKCTPKSPLQLYKYATMPSWLVGVATQTFAPGGKHPRDATCKYKAASQQAKIP